jgi:hypothetical protein
MPGHDMLFEISFSGTGVQTEVALVFTFAQSFGFNMILH